MRHRIVRSASRRQLEQAIATLLTEGWRPIGESAVAAPDDLRQPPHWVRVLYQSARTVPLDILEIPPPPDSVFNGDEKV